MLEPGKIETIVIAQDSFGMVRVVRFTTEGEHEVMEVGHHCIGFEEIDSGMMRVRMAAQALAKARPKFPGGPKFSLGNPQPAFED